MGLFSLRMHRNSYFGTPLKNLKPPFAPATSISYKTDALPLPSDVYWIYSMFLCYYVAWPFWPWPLTFWLWECFMYSAYHFRPTYQFYYPMTIGYWVTSILNIWSHFRYLKQSLRMRRVTWPLTGGKNSPHFWNPWPQFTYSRCHFQGATTNIKPCYRQKNSVFPLWRLQSLLRMRSITWPVHRRSPKTTRNNFLTPNCLFSIQLSWGYDDD